MFQCTERSCLLTTLHVTHALEMSTSQIETNLASFKFVFNIIPVLGLKHVSCLDVGSRVQHGLKALPSARVHHHLSDLRTSIWDPLKYKDFVGFSTTTLVSARVIHYYYTGQVLVFVLTIE